MIDEIINSDLEGDDLEKFKALAQDKSNRVVLFNVWRPLKIVFRDPFAVSDWSTVRASIQAHGYKPRGDTPRRYPCMQWNPSSEHTWYFMSLQTPGEPTVFVQYDSTAEGYKAVPHSLFVHPDYKGGPDRESIEVGVATIIPKGMDIQKIISSKVSPIA